MQEPKLKSLFVTWILISSLVLSPLIAEAQDRSPHPLKIERARQRLMKEPTAPPSAAALLLVPPNELDVLPDRTSSATADATPGPSTSPGKASAAIIGVLIAGGVALATLLYFGLRGGSKTVLQAGTPRVNAP
jgi:hypothetical protein